MVLSGGLGNSAYVRDQLHNRYAHGNAPHINACSLQIRVAPDPQLVVCKGNVADRVQKLKSGQSVLGWRCCRSSYGLRCKVKHDPNNPAYFGLNTARDALDGQLYVMDYIDWLIKQVSPPRPVVSRVANEDKGEPVSSDHPIVRPFSRKCSPATPLIPNPPRVFPSDIICSDVEKSMLPVIMDSCKICLFPRSLPRTYNL